MGRKRVKKSCTSCGFTHTESGKECLVPKAVEEELEEASEEPIGAIGVENSREQPTVIQT